MKNIDELLAQANVDIEAVSRFIDVKFSQTQLQQIVESLLAAKIKAFLTSKIDDLVPDFQKEIMRLIRRELINPENIKNIIAGIATSHCEGCYLKETWD